MGITNIILKMRGPWIAIAALLGYSARDTATAPPSATCVATYEVQVDDDCNSVAKAMNVSTYHLLEANNLDLYCQTFDDQVGKTLCIPPSQCTTYTWGPYDSCSNIDADLDGVTVLQFFAWNPNWDSLCLNTPLFLGYEVCMSPPGGYLDYGLDTEIPTATSDPGFVYTPPPLPPAAPGTLSGCYEYDATSFEDDLCRDLALDYEVSFEDLVLWNPSLEDNMVNCTLSTAYSYCVKLYENSTIPDTTTMCLSIEATEPGTASDCSCFTYVDSYFIPDYTCDNLLDIFDITLSQLLAWNTWLAAEDCTTSLFANLGYLEDRSVCVGVGSTSTTTTPTPTSTSSATKTTTTSMVPTQTGVVDGCQLFHTVQNGETCPYIESQYGITASQFYAWNPSIGSTCTNLWLGYAYCVEGPDSSSNQPINQVLLT